MSSEVESSFLDTTLSSVTDTEHKPGRHAAGHHHQQASVSGAILERRQLLHNVELLKLSVSMKDNQLQEMKQAHAVQVEDLEEKLADQRHQCKLLQARLDYATRAQLGSTAQYEQRLTTLEQSKKQLEDSCGDLRGQLADLLKVCDAPLVSASDFQRLKNRSVERLTPCELLQVGAGT